MNLEDHVIFKNSSIRESLSKIDLNKNGFLLVFDEDTKIIGLVTDGDIRRYLLKNDDLNQKIENCINRDFIYSDLNYTYEEIYKKLDSKIKVIPILDDSKKLVSIITKNNIPERQEHEFYARSKSPVRISFGGGGSDTTEYFKDNLGAVINSTISIYSHASLYKRKDSKIVIDSLDLDKKCEYNNISQFEKKDDDFKLFRALMKIIKPKFGFDLIIQSDFPISSGLGGSSVVLSAVIGCFNQFRNHKWTPYDMAEIAFEAERLHLGISGGWQDQYATVFGGFNFIEFRKKENLVFPIKLNDQIISELEETLILCYTKTKHDSNEIHESQKTNTTREKIKEIIKANVSLTYEMRNFLLKGELDSLGEGLDKAWSYKKTFSDKISNDYLDDIYKTAIENGASGGKLLGAGGGGYFLFFVPARKRNDFIKWSNLKGLIYTPFRFEDKGIQSWSIKM